MRVTANSGAAFRADLPARERVYQTPKQAPAENRSLVVQLAAARSAPAPTGRPLAALLAQLIAKAEDMPETRLKRRIDAAEGANVYRVAMRGIRSAHRTVCVI